MTTHASSTPILSTYLAEPLEVGEPDISGPLAVFPLFGPPARLHYISFVQGREGGVAVHELDEAASVNDLVVQNPTGEPVLLCEGEEVLGAQQNRVFDITVLVAARSKAKVPVSCVEAGRWQHSRHRERLTPSPQHAYPELRRERARHVRERLAAGLEARADQSEVWDQIDLKAARHGTHSRTGAMHDVYEARRDRIDRLTNAVSLRDSQIGVLVAIGGKFTVLDHVSRPDAFASLHQPLLQGYALDALEAEDASPPSIDEARGFVALVTGTQPSERDGVSLGRELRFLEDGITGSGLVAGDELIQLTAFPEKIE